MRAITGKLYGKNPLIRNPFLKISLFCFLYKGAVSFQEQPEMFPNLIDKRLFNTDFLFLVFSVMQFSILHYYIDISHLRLKNGFEVQTTH